MVLQIRALKLVLFLTSMKPSMGTQWWLLIGLSRRDVVEPIWVDSFQWECNSGLWEDCTLSGREVVEPIKSYKTASVWINNPTWLGYHINTHTHLPPKVCSFLVNIWHLPFNQACTYKIAVQICRPFSSWWCRQRRASRPVKYFIQFKVGNKVLYSPPTERTLLAPNWKDTPAAVKENSLNSGCWLGFNFYFVHL